MARRLFFLSLALAFSTSILLAELDQEKEPPSPLEHEIVVTATRIETPAKEVAGSFTILSSSDLVALKKSTVLEVLREVPGLAIAQNGGDGGAASVFIRGANSEQTLVLMDGIELNDPINPSRSFDLAYLPLENIDRIEILRGPQSTLFGSDGIGGVVHIITKRGQGKPKISLNSSIGTLSTVQGQAGLSASNGQFHYSLGTSYFGTQGISAASTSYAGNEEADGTKTISFSGRLGYSPTENIDLDLVLRSLSASTDIDNFGGPYGDDPNNIQEYRSFFIKGQLRTLALQNRWEQRLAIAFIRSRRTLDNREDPAHPTESESGLYKGRLTKVDWQNNFFLHPQNTLTAGAEIEKEEGESEYFYSGLWGSGASLFPRQYAQTIGVYLQDQMRVSGRLFLTLGARLDFHSQAGQAFTYRLAPAYLIERTGTKIKATYSTGFKSPSLFQLYAPGSYWGPVGNPSLEPERSSSWDVGVEQVFGGSKWLVGATYFHNSYKDLISFNTLEGYVNIGRAMSRGVELFLEARPHQAIFLKVSYTNLEAVDLEDGSPLLRRPEETLAAGLTWRPAKKWEFTISFLHIGERVDLDFSTWPSQPVTLPAYDLLNGTAAFILNNEVEFFVRFDNLLDEWYEMVRGYGTCGFRTSFGARFSFNP